MPSTLGKYILGKTLGSGASCKVKIGKSSDGKFYAVKIIKKDDELKEFIDAEVSTLRKLHHENIVILIDMGYDTLKKDKGSK